MTPILEHATATDEDHRADAIAASLFAAEIVSHTQPIERLDGEVVCVAVLSVPTSPDADHLVVRGDGPAPQSISISVAGQSVRCSFCKTVGGWYSAAPFTPPHHFWVSVEIHVHIAGRCVPPALRVSAPSARNDAMSMIESTLLPCRLGKIERIVPAVRDGSIAIRKLLMAGDAASALDAFIDAAADPDFLIEAAALGRDVLAGVAADADIRIEKNALTLLAILSS